MLPPIVIGTDEARRLGTLANSSMAVFPRVAHFLARETERANVVAERLRPARHSPHGFTGALCDDKTGDIRDVVLVYPHEADISLKRISVLTPVGAALIGLSVGQTIEFQTPDHQKRSLTVLGISS